MRTLVWSRVWACLAWVSLYPVSSVAGQSALEADREAVTQAVLDYVEGIYEVEPDRIQQSVHPDLVKLGYWRTADQPYETSPMSFDQLVEIAETWNADGRVSAETATKEIVVFDVLDQTATARLTADWGVDHMQLAKYDGQWKIVHVLWQSHPPE